MYKLHQITWCQNYQFVFGSVCNRYTYHYYKMWVQFTSPHSLDLWIHSKSSEITWHTGTPFVVYSWQWVVQAEACVCMTCIVVFISVSKGYPIFLSYVVVIVFTSPNLLLLCDQLPMAFKEKSQGYNVWYEAMTLPHQCNFKLFTFAIYYVALN
jgi:hypothetical protein